AHGSRRKRWRELERQSVAAFVRAVRGIAPQGERVRFMDDLPTRHTVARPNRRAEPARPNGFHRHITDRIMSPLHSVQVCLVEDDDIMGESLADRFALEGFSCDWHKSAQSAAVGLREKRYDVVVSDIRLPDRNGDELFEELQASQLYVPPWIFITGYG